MFDFLKPAWKSPDPKKRKAAYKKMSQDELFKLLVKQAKEPFANEIFSHIKDKDILEKLRNMGIWFEPAPKKTPSKTNKSLNEKSYQELITNRNPKHSLERLKRIISSIHDEERLLELALAIMHQWYETEQFKEYNRIDAVEFIAKKIKDTAFLNRLGQNIAARFVKHEKAIKQVWELLQNIENRILPQTTEEWVSILEDVQFENYFTWSLCKKIVDRDIMLAVFNAKTELFIKKSILYQLKTDDELIAFYNLVKPIDSILTVQLVETIKDKQKLYNLIKSNPELEEPGVLRIDDNFLKENDERLFELKKNIIRIESSIESEKRFADLELQREAWEIDRKYR